VEIVVSIEKSGITIVTIEITAGIIEPEGMMTAPGMIKPDRRVGMMPPRLEPTEPIAIWTEVACGYPIADGTRHQERPVEGVLPVGVQAERGTLQRLVEGVMVRRTLMARTECILTRRNGRRNKCDWIVIGTARMMREPL
jgi:hypothetical protein